MGDYGFGLLQTSSGPNSGGSSSSALFGGGAAFRAAFPASSSSSQFQSLSPGGGCFSSTSGSALFLSAGYQQQQQIMQDELLLSSGNSTKSSQQHHQPSPPALLLLHGAQESAKQKRKDFSPQEGDAFREELKQQAPGEISQHHNRGSPSKSEELEAQDKLLPASPCSTSSSSSSCSSSAEEVGEVHAGVPSPGHHQHLPAKSKLHMESHGGHLLSGAPPNLLGAPYTGSPEQIPAGTSSPPALPGFGTPWSVQTSSPPPQPPPLPAPHPAGPGHNLNALQSPDPDSFYPGIPSSINPAFFQSFSAVSANPCPGLNVPGFSSPFSAQINISQQQQQPPQNRRSPVSPQMNPQHHQAAAFLQQRNSYNHHQPIVKQSPWSTHQGSGWSTGGMSWGGMHGRDHRRTANMGIPGTMNQISPLKKPYSGNVIAPPKFTRTNQSLTPKSWIEDNLFRTDNNSNTLLPLQDRGRMYDSLNMHSLENSLIEIMRAEHDPLKGRLNYPHPGTDSLLMLNARSYGRRRGRSSLFPIDDGLLDDGHNDQVLNSPNCYSGHQNGERIERFSRKVFVGGLPPDIDEDEITASFRRFGPLVVDWPHKAESKSYFPPKGYAFLLFQEESSVQALIDACIEEEGKLYLCVSSPTIKDKPVQIRPWNLSDSDFVMDGSQPLDPRKTIFVGGVPRPLRAVELAMIMDRLYGGVCYAGIDTDPELKYPKGAGRVAFSNQQSYIAAISARFVQLQHGDIDKRVEVKPYVLDDQMCDECQGARCSGKFAPFFCANVTCLQYYCEFCWANIHSRAGREFHKPLVKEGADRPRQIHFRWN
ncbi:cytoplasmic polyadenylation element-binding protein 2 isoform X2 [Bombina bombina]|uniref:cytoplasmic polyadenylation element-binding protein 2 isoform X2 n=1 Tax=Bombina bombina TaxID=8345 RepID=UPI00235A4DDD|nr:cytoplasmic polyadenylation element-binding protein 2 isoform X2 [Bombina bombina]